MRFQGQQDPFSDRLHSLLTRAEMLEKRLDRWADSLSTLIFDLHRLVEDSCGGHRPPEPARESKLFDAMVCAIHIRKHPNGAAVRIDEADWMELPPSLADLLVVLCDGSGKTDDELIPWKSFAEAVQRLGKDPSIPADRHAVIVRISKLRRALIRRGFDPQLVQTSRRYGVRFALKRGRS